MCFGCFGSFNVKDLSFFFRFQTASSAGATASQDGSQAAAQGVGAVGRRYGARAVGLGELAAELRGVTQQLS